MTRCERRSWRLFVLEFMNDGGIHGAGQGRAMHDRGLWIVIASAPVIHRGDALGVKSGQFAPVQRRP